MGTIAQEYERLKFELSKGRGSEKIHVTFVERDQAERIKNNKRVTRFTLETKNPDICADLHREWERVIKKMGNKTLALDLWVRSLRESLSDATLDKINAALDSEHG